MQGTPTSGVGHHGYVHAAHVPSADLINAAAALLPKGMEFADKLRGIYSGSRDHRQVPITSIPGSSSSSSSSSIGSPGVRTPLHLTDDHIHHAHAHAQGHGQGQTRTVQFHPGAEGGRKSPQKGHDGVMLSQGHNHNPAHFVTGMFISCPVLPCPVCCICSISSCCIQCLILTLLQILLCAV